LGRRWAWRLARGRGDVAGNRDHLGTNQPSLPWGNLGAIIDEEEEEGGEGLFLGLLLSSRHQMWLKFCFTVRAMQPSNTEAKGVLISEVPSRSRSVFSTYSCSRSFTLNHPSPSSSWSAWSRPSPVGDRGALLPLSPLLLFPLLLLSPLLLLLPLPSGDFTLGVR